MRKKIRKMTCVITAVLLAISMAACGGSKPSNGGDPAQGAVPGYVETEIGTEAGLIAPVTVNSDNKGNLVVYDEGKQSPAYVTLDKDGKRLGEVRCDFTGEGSVFSVGSDGSLYIVARIQDEANGTMANRLLIYDAAGKKLAETDLGKTSMEMRKGPFQGYSSIAVDKDGNAYLANPQNGIGVYGKDGTKIRDIDRKDCSMLAFDRDGKLVAYGMASGQPKLSLEKLDPMTGTSIWKQDITPKALNINGSFGRIRTGASDGSIYMLGDGKIEKFDSSGKRLEPALRFLDYSVAGSGNEASDFIAASSGGFFLLASSRGPVMKMVKNAGPDQPIGGKTGSVPGGGKAAADGPATAAGSAPGEMNSGNSANAGNIDKAGAGGKMTNAPDGMPEGGGFSIYRYDPDLSGNAAKSKETIKLTISRSDRYIETAVGKFQKANPDYRIHLTYYEDESGTDMENAIKNLNTSILSGNGPDILSVNGLPFQKYAEKNLLADLDQLIQKDKSFDMSQYYGNILDAVRINGKRYAMPISFSFSALFANKSILDRNEIRIEDSKWTWKDFQAAADRIEKNGGGIKALPQMNYNDLLSVVMTGNYSKFIDPVRKTSQFASQEFYDILNLVKTYGGNSTSGGGKAMLSDEAVNRGAVAFVPWDIGDYIFYSMLTSMAGGNVEMLKYPSENGNTQNCFNSNRDRIFSINANSKYTDKAWEFLKLLMSEEMQSSMDLNGFAVNKAALEANAKQQIDVTTKGNVMMNLNGTVIKPVPLTQEAIDVVNGFISKLNTYANFDEQVVKIGMDELKSYFAGDKSAEEVCKLIQNRVNTYLGE